MLSGGLRQIPGFLKDFTDRTFKQLISKLMKIDRVHIGSFCVFYQMFFFFIGARCNTVAYLLHEQNMSMNAVRTTHANCPMFELFQVKFLSCLSELRVFRLSLFFLVFFRNMEQLNTQAERNSPHWGSAGDVRGELPTTHDSVSSHR